MRESKFFVSFVFLMFVTIAMPCRSADKSAKTTQDSSSGGNAGPTSGVWYSTNDIPTTYIKRKRQRTVCYKLVKIDDETSLQPFALEPSTTITKACPTTAPNILAMDPQYRDACNGSTEIAPKSYIQNGGCDIINQKHPLLSGQRLIIAIDPTKVADTAQIKGVVLNLSTQQGTPINAAPVRPVFAPPGLAPVKKYSEWFLVWPFDLVGDMIPTITVNAVFRSPEAASETSMSAATSSITKTPPSDTYVTLLNLTLPQIHQLYYYNVSTGVIASSLKNPTFTRTQLALPPNPQFTTTRDDGDISVAPVLMFTGYFRPLDAESPWQRSDLTPGLSLGFSLTSPATSFYFGGSSEIRRNVQLVYGLNYGKVNQLAPAGVVDPSSNAAPATIQRFKNGAFIGLTFNIDFIKGLFSGGSGSKTGSQ